MTLRQSGFQDRYNPTFLGQEINPLRIVVSFFFFPLNLFYYISVPLLSLLRFAADVALFRHICFGPGPGDLHRV